MSLQKASEFMEQHPTCVIATVNKDGTPEAATIGFSHADSFEILIGTNKKSRKYQNLVERSNVAIVLGFEGVATVQIEGKAKEITPAQDQLDKFYTKVPGAKKFQNQEGQTYFMITPTWLRLTDYASEVPIFETEQF